MRYHSRPDHIAFASICSLLTILAVTGRAARLCGQETLVQASPLDYGLVLPKARPLPGEGRRVLVLREDRDPIVGTVYLEVGDRYVVVLPSGRIVSLEKREALPTDRPFEPISKADLAQKLVTGRFRGFKTRTTRRYLYVYNSSDLFATFTGNILETMHPKLAAYCENLGLDVQESQFPLVVLIFKTQAEFRKYRDVPEGIVAYYNPLSNFIVMYEQSDLAQLAPELAFKQAISTIAHEGVHQILHNIGVQQRLSEWPMWISEGLADYFAPTELGRRVRWKGVGFPNDLRLHELSEFYKGLGNQPSTRGELLRQTVESTSLNSLGYATAWSMVHYLTKRQRKDFRDYLIEISHSKPLEPTASSKLFSQKFGNDFIQLENDLIQHLKSLPYTDPVANQTHYVVLMTDRERRNVLVTSSPAKVRELLKSEANGKRVLIESFANRYIAESFAKKWLAQ
jgi:hypothetical protein